MAVQYQNNGLFMYECLRVSQTAVSYWALHSHHHALPAVHFHVSAVSEKPYQLQYLIYIYNQRNDMTEYCC
jgi:hypothetical protein